MSSPTERSIKLSIPLLPVSVNHYKMRSKHGHWYVTKEAIAFKNAIIIFAKGRSVAAQRFQVNVKLYLGKGQRLDCDNCGKVILDGLQEACVISSDAKVYDFHVQKFRDPANPRTEIDIVELA